eukprot:g446.t1
MVRLPRTPALFPLFAFASAVLTLFLTAIVASATEHYWQGSSLPPVSVLGRSSAFPVFATGMTIVGLFSCGVSYHVFKWVESAKKRLNSSSPSSCKTYLCSGLFTFGGLNLAGLALSNDRKMYYNDIALHIWTTIIFYLSILAAVIINYKLTKTLTVVSSSKDDETKSAEDRAFDKHLNLSLKIKRRMLGILFFTIMLHVPLGYVIVPAICNANKDELKVTYTKDGSEIPVGRVEMARCVAPTSQSFGGDAYGLGLSQEFCDSWKDEEKSYLTRLRDRSYCPSNQQSFMVTRDEFEKASKDVIERATHPCGVMLSEAYVKKDEIDAVAKYVGDSDVAKYVGDNNRSKLKTSIDPDLAVAIRAVMVID